MLELVVGTYVRGVQAGDHFAIDTAWRGAEVFPVLALLLGCPSCVQKHAVLATELTEQKSCQIAGDFFIRAVVARDVIFGGQFMEFLRAANLVDLRLTLGGKSQGMHQVATVVAVGRRAGSHLSQEVSGHDGVYVGTADPHLALGSNAAWSHGAVSAADSRLAELALWCLGL